MIKWLRKGFGSWREASLAPFRLKLFRGLWVAALVSNVGAAVQAVGASWSMVTMSASPQIVALVQTAATLPIVLLALPAGALADNVDRRTLMIAAQILGAFSAAVLAALSFAGLLSPLALLGLTFGVGSAVALYQPPWQASLGDIVPRKFLPAAVSLNVLGFNLARSIGPLVGGVAIASLGSSITFLFNAFSFLILISVLTFARFPKADRRHPPEQMIPAIATGLRFVSLSPALQQIYVRASLFGFGASAVWSLLPVIAHARFGGSPMTFGLLMGALGAGSFCGAIVSTWFRSFTGNDRMVTLSVGGFGSATLGLAFSPLPVLSAVFAFAAGVAWIFVFTTTRTCVQLSSPRWVVGRTVSFGQVATFGCMSIGAACWGALANVFSVDTALLIAGGFLLLSMLAALVAKLPSTDPNDVAAQPERRSPPPPRIALHGEDGPVVVTIEYDVPPERASEFLTLMNELSRVRRRNGATLCTLQQDIDKPESWIERVHSPTWSDHLRRLDRYTADERELVARAETFRTSEQKSVRRMVERPRSSA